MGLARELRERRTIPLREVSVSAWADEKGKPFKLYTRAITCYDLNELQKKHPNFLENTTIAAMVDLIILKATDKGGERIFTNSEDLIDLMGEETSVISEIANQMFADIETVETKIKN